MGGGRKGGRGEGVAASHMCHVILTGTTVCWREPGSLAAGRGHQLASASASSTSSSSSSTPYPSGLVLTLCPRSRHSPETSSQWVWGEGEELSHTLSCLPACLRPPSLPGQVFFAILVGAFYLGQGGTNYQLLLEASQAVSNMSAIIKRVCVCVHGTCVCVQQYSYLVATATGY